MIFCRSVAPRYSPQLSPQVLVERTLKLSLLLGQAAAQASIGVYIRVLSEYYQLQSPAKDKRVGDPGTVSIVWGRRARWIHESARGLANMDNLKVILVRPGILYGGMAIAGSEYVLLLASQLCWTDACSRSTVIPRVLVGELYKFQQKKLEFLQVAHTMTILLRVADSCATPSRWSEALAQNTLHSTDFCRALLAAAAYALPLSRSVGCLCAQSILL